MTVLWTHRLIHSEHLKLEYLHVLPFTNNQVIYTPTLLTGTYSVEFISASVSISRYFPPICCESKGMINYINHFGTLVVYQITSKGLFKFYEIVCNIIQGL